MTIQPFIDSRIIWPIGLYWAVVLIHELKWVCFLPVPNIFFPCFYYAKGITGFLALLLVGIIAIMIVRAFFKSKKAAAYALLAHLVIATLATPYTLESVELFVWSWR
ncbi:hypothetical protein [Micavibrio aeruginosavorus]|uniref:hypothetical protein n=1 Tax=Micavibrio aeruginosavorus TaxID=349221 RepID=UPI003F4ACC5C